MDARSATLLLFFTAVLGSFGALAGPRTPLSDDEVLERVSEGTRSARVLWRLQERVAGSPAGSARLARAYVELGRATGDPRYMGRAQGMLAPWWDLAAPDPEVLLLRAVLRQWHHQFRPALLDLDQLISLRPHDGQAWLIRASVEQVIGEYGLAASSCARVSELLPGLVATTCGASIASLTGSLVQARAALTTALDGGAPPSPGVEAWSRTALAEMAVRAGDAPSAERELRRALSLERDPYTLAALADLLLDGERPAEALELLRDSTADGLLLRLAEAEAALGAATLPDHVGNLRDRFQSARARGDSVHLREEARFALRLERDPPRAVRLARENWSVQREPADARLFVEAARAAANPEAAAPVREFVRRHGMEDAVLDALEGGR